ncbi:iron(III) dicitrate-binding protein [Conexivisphaera calida]|uniref:Iron(III) dicitrate-binding protein n=1 Tax=Conexivisphaera calida TaxID=1874277 RepID=A0A4P2VCG3_9ARCH|nr:iron(III) dicitrate-binding protein [Conexivisphaera calida]
MVKPSICVRIASLSPTASDILGHVGAIDELVGVSSYCLPFIGQRKRVIGSYTTVSLKALRELNPDVVFLEGVVQDGLKDVVEGAGFRTILLPFPRSLGTILDDVILVGTLAGRHRESVELAARLREGMRPSELDGGKRPRVYVEFWLGRDEEDRVVPGALTYVDEMIYVAGGINVLSDVPRGFSRLDPGEVVRLDPDVVIFHLDPFLKMDPEILGRRGWTGIRAVRSGRVHTIWESSEVNLAHHGPSTLVRSISWLSSVISEARKT